MDRSQRLASLVACYDAQAEHREAQGEPAWRDDIRAEFAALLAPGSRLLEIGAGVGYSARWFVDRGLDVLATDLSPANVALCRAKGVIAEVRDMQDTGFGDTSFDGVWAASCLMHIPNADIDTVLGEVERVLKPGGVFWAGTWGDEVTHEGIWEDDRRGPKRFYSLRSDDDLRAIYARRFEVLSFDSFRPEPDFEWHYQSALLKRRR